MWKDENGQTIRDTSLEEDEYSFKYLKNKIDNADGKGTNIEIKE
jgi:hypothetical protein